MATVNSNNSWSAGVISKMKTLFEKGMSTAEIGKRLGFSKNAVVGKINRLGWSVKGKSSKPAAKTKVQIGRKKAAPLKKSLKKAPVPVKKTVAKPKAKSSKSAEERKISKKNIERVIQHSSQLMALRPDQCRWPLGDPDSDDFHFCGEKCFTGKPYCFEHCKVAYQFQAPPKRK